MLLSLGVVSALVVKMLPISPILSGTQGDCRRETQSKGDRYKMEAGGQVFLLLLVNL
jgi:hypothetical protein